MTTRRDLLQIAACAAAGAALPDAMAAVAGANRCQAVWMESYGFSTVFGFPGDLDDVDHGFALVRRY